jgi:DNA-directed RNA polymerase subunit RPC12/RpoP
MHGKREYSRREYDSLQDIAPDTTTDEQKFRNLCQMLKATSEPEIRARLIEEINELRYKLNGVEPPKQSVVEKRSAVETTVCSYCGQEVPEDFEPQEYTFDDLAEDDSNKCPNCGQEMDDERSWRVKAAQRLAGL